MLYPDAGLHFEVIEQDLFAILSMLSITEPKSSLRLYWSNLQQPVPLAVDAAALRNSELDHQGLSGWANPLGLRLCRCQPDVESKVEWAMAEKVGMLVGSGAVIAELLYQTMQVYQ